MLPDIGEGGQWWFTSFYGATRPDLQTLVWEELSIFIVSVHFIGVWVARQLQCCNIPNEKLRGGQVNSTMRVFEPSIWESELRDLPLANAQFTQAVTKGYITLLRLDLIYKQLGECISITKLFIAKALA